MYQVKPTSVDFEIQIPNCMYKVKIDQTSSTALRTNEEFIKVNHTTVKSFDILDGKINTLLKKSDMENIEARQELLLDQLHKFKTRLLEIRKKLKLNISPKKGNTTVNKNLKNEDLGFRKKSLDIFENYSEIDIVVNAHPKFVPYGLLGIKNAWKNQVNFDVKIFSHSTLQDISPEAKHFQKQITDGSITNSKNPSIKTTIIWKNCEHTEMISSPTMYKPIYGEINILRFLARIGPYDFRYDFTSNANQIDSILDICYQLLRCSGNAQQELLRNLSKLLDKQKFFGGENLSIADIAVSSSLKRIQQAALKNLPENMKKWQNIIKNILY
ncbi:probable aminoacyl tRNA synthase complex-interacting multifunctional protein 2 [Condylostylus longicornis]|uniref:probable aminoacyl tRNA synthase complex-interacting multifunctional protein 2 n=1 Tax=Condylostylus longicornis TaxID=2530218 RepID=UPI00244DB88A|nr:probable aminoacyl tRNA synthase complex-interacting multifunctional protein 2 [Condylostylus longicornis]XP_055380822.1 probable aminoacyl tRNA synthase complex-interacting multifunctional protein 2 [Condylostylus longicornis]